MKKTFRYIQAFTLSMLLAITTFAQTAAPAADAPHPVQIPKMFFEPVTYIWLMMGFIILLTIYTLSRTVSELTKELERKSGVTAAEPFREHVRRETFWSRLMKSMTRSVPVEKEADVMLDHNYDGIRELDNQLPPWWVYGFYLTIIFAFCYIFYYHLSGSGKLQIAEYNNEMKVAEQERLVRMENNANFVTEDNVQLLKDGGELSEGHAIFVKNCVSCHGDNAQGNVGPNLTDEYWLHGGNIKSLFRTITEGVTGKGMISWKSQLAPKKIEEVASYILSLQGTHPAGAKEPQGEKWVEPTATDSAAVASSDTVKVAESSVKK